jgi:hypothetical protein
VCKGIREESRAAFDKTIEPAGNTAETAYLTRRRDQLGNTRVLVKELAKFDLELARGASCVGAGRSVHVDQAS